MTGEDILTAMATGATLHSCRFGFFLIKPDGRSQNVHNGAAKALARRRVIKRVNDTEWVKARTSDELRQEILNRMTHFYTQTDGTLKLPNSCEGDLLKLVKDYFDLTQQKSK